MTEQSPESPQSLIVPAGSIAFAAPMTVVSGALARHELAGTDSPALSEAVVDNVAIIGSAVEQYPVPAAIIFGATAVLNGIQIASRLRQRRSR